MMNRDGQFAPVGGVVAGVFRGWQIRRINRHLHLQRQVIPRDIAAGRGQIQRVLGDFRHQVWKSCSVSCAARLAGPVALGRQIS